MNNTNKIILFGSGATILGVAAYFIIKKMKQKKALQLEAENITKEVDYATSDEMINTAPPKKINLNASVSVGNGFPLQNGSRGENVKKVQAFLNQKFNSGLVVDGIFGSKTGAAVKLLNGKGTVSEDEFKQFIGKPVNEGAAIGNSVKSPNLLLTALSTINPVFSLFK